MVCIISTAVEMSIRRGIPGHPHLQDRKPHRKPHSAGFSGASAIVYVLNCQKVINIDLESGIINYF